jgi:hypothetical protein
VGCARRQRWQEIAELLPGRTENGVKNHWSAWVTRELRSSTLSALITCALPNVFPHPIRQVHAAAHGEAPCRRADRERRRCYSRACHQVRKTPTSAFYSCIPTGVHGPSGIFWANLTPFSPSDYDGSGRDADEDDDAGAQPEGKIHRVDPKFAS